MSFYRWCLIGLIALNFGSGRLAEFCSAQNYGSRATYQNQFSTPRVDSYGRIQHSYSNQSAKGIAYPSTSLQPTYGIAIPGFQSLVTDREHDFGVVATASKQEHVFEFENTTGQELILNSVRASCGCTKPSILTSKLKPGETGRVKAVLDTRSFQGDKAATLTVSVQKIGIVSEYGELQFAVKGKIRRDVVFNPGEVKFQDVTLANGISRTVRVSYAGNPQWAIVDVKSSSPNISVAAKEVSRDPRSRHINYDLHLNLEPSQPAGMINEFVTIKTNDAKTDGMQIQVTGRIKPVLEAAPINLGILNQGKVITKKWIVRGSGAFRVQQVKSSNPAIRFAECEGERSVHILTYTLDTSQVGDIDDEISIVTDNTGQNATKVKFSAQIVAATTVLDKP